jgi:hypothetical protein
VVELLDEIAVMGPARQGCICVVEMPLAACTTASPQTI